MSIQPPSDIVMDVARAADPGKRDAALRRLETLSGDAGASFATTLASTRNSTDAVRTDAAALRTNMAIAKPTAANARAPSTPHTMHEAMGALETVFLRNAFDTMLPASSHVPGFAGAGAGAFKSMLADALANQVAASGGLGILSRREPT